MRILPNAIKFCGYFLNAVDEDLFSVTRTNNFTGAILLNNELDYEQITSYTIEVSVINDEDLATYLCQEPVQIRNYQFIIISLSY